MNYDRFPNIKNKNNFLWILKKHFIVHERQFDEEIKKKLKTILNTKKIFHNSQCK